MSHMYQVVTSSRLRGSGLRLFIVTRHVRSVRTRGARPDQDTQSSGSNENQTKTRQVERKVKERTKKPKTIIIITIIIIIIIHHLSFNRLMTVCLHCQLVGLPVS